MSEELYHHGILGQKWGVRRYQNSDGSLTSAGKRRYHGQREDAQEYKYNRSGESAWKRLKRKRAAQKEEMKKYGEWEDAQEYKYSKSNESGMKGLNTKTKAESSHMSNKTKTVLIVGATVATTSLTLIGMAKLSQIANKADAGRQVVSTVMNTASTNGSRSVTNTARAAVNTTANRPKISRQDAKRMKELMEASKAIANQRISQYGTRYFG